jgi:hypothetical protein
MPAAIFAARYMPNGDILPSAIDASRYLLILAFGDNSFAIVASRNGFEFCK